MVLAPGKHGIDLIETFVDAEERGVEVGAARWECSFTLRRGE